MTEEQFTALVKKHRTSLVELAYSVVKDWNDAEDAVQDGLLRLSTNIDRYDASLSQPFSWMATSILNRCKSILKKRKATLEREEPLIVDDENDTFSGEEINEFVALDIQKAIATLSIPERMTIHLHFYLGYTEREIALGMNVTDRTVRNRLARGKIQLGAILADYAPTEQSLQEIVPPNGSKPEREGGEKE